MNIQMISAAVGLVLTVGAGGAITEMPADATITQWLSTAAVAVVGLISMYIATTVDTND